MKETLLRTARIMPVLLALLVVAVCAPKVAESQPMSDETFDEERQPRVVECGDLPEGISEVDIQELQSLIELYQEMMQTPIPDPLMLTSNAFTAQALPSIDFGNSFPEINSFAWVGQSLNLWGRVSGGSGRYSATWDPGDGTGPLAAKVASPDYIYLRHTYINSGPKSAVISVTDLETGEVASATVRVDVDNAPPSRQTQFNAAIEGIRRYLYLNQDPSRLVLSDNGLGTSTILATPHLYLTLCEDSGVVQSKYGSGDAGGSICGNSISDGGYFVSALAEANGSASSSPWTPWKWFQRSGGTVVATWDGWLRLGGEPGAGAEIQIEPDLMFTYLVWASMKGFPCVGGEASVTTQGIVSTAIYDSTKTGYRNETVREYALGYFAVMFGWYSGNKQLADDSYSAGVMRVGEYLRFKVQLTITADARINPCGDARAVNLSIFGVKADIDRVFITAYGVDVDPDVLNPRSGGKWVTSYIELPEGYDPADIDVSTVTLNEAVPAELSPTSVGDYDSDGVPDRMFKFSRSALIDTLPQGEYVEVRVTGQVGEEGFTGKDTIRVLMPKLVYPNGGQTLQAQKQYTVSWKVPAGYAPDYYDVFYTTDDGSSWNAVAEHVIDTSCNWTVPAVASAACRVLVEAHDELGIMGCDVSDKTFGIVTTVISRPGDVVPTSFTLRLVGANPSVSGGLFEFDLLEASHVRVMVFDVRGSLVRQLVDEKRPVGSYLIQWDGKNVSGGDVPAGIYFVRVEAGEYKMTEKVVMVR